MKSVKFESVEEYLKSLPSNSRERLKTIRALIRKSIPEAEEVISYQMPAFKYHGMLVWYAAFKNHYSLFMPRILKNFKNELKDYETSKSAIRIPLEKPVPVQLIRSMIKFGAKQNVQTEKLKLKKRSK